MRSGRGNLVALAKTERRNTMVVITTNASIKNSGALVMGAGAAKDFRDAYPGLDLKCGIAVSKSISEAEGCMDYGFLPINDHFGIFQVKVFFRAQASFYLIELSAKMLASHAKANQDWTYHVNYPGIGYGGLYPDAVKKTLLECGWDELDNIVIWQKE